MKRKKKKKAMQAGAAGEVAGGGTVGVGIFGLWQVCDVPDIRA